VWKSKLNKDPLGSPHGFLVKVLIFESSVLKIKSHGAPPIKHVHVNARDAKVLANQTKAIPCKKM
jgi:hypothetical protein